MDSCRRAVGTGTGTCRLAGGDSADFADDEAGPERLGDAIRIAIHAAFAGPVANVGDVTREQRQRGRIETRIDRLREIDDRGLVLPIEELNGERSPCTRS